MPTPFPIWSPVSQEPTPYAGPPSICLRIEFNGASVFPQPPPGAIQTAGPWLAGLFYGVVPLQPLPPVPDNGEKWFTITRGKYVSLTKNPAISFNTVVGVSHALSDRCNSQADTLNLFNGALALNAISPNKPRRQKKGYAVFRDRVPGAYKTWAEVEPLVRRVSGALHQGYPSFDNAVRAFQYAEHQNWPRVCPRPVTPPTTATISILPQPVGSLDRPNLLYAGLEFTATSRWYVVYRGITPGVYQFNLESGLNTVGVPGAVFDSWETKIVAIVKYQHALGAKRVTAIPPAY
ncbi:hypothetical protein B0H16DRAFT_1711663 [Mycena metata]|uniref:Ribonuclease H1 N-terminal domain-containing protein n=1 Tax=Mycena metata TaxID=1033252 RepID=A0AAD7NVY0_9AGAR|nr:hypothetical protein B0H16DRAFT_1711663 [Mycena metata]